MAAVIFLLFGAGGLLVAAGWFGRRLDDHPWCVKCGHDLFGSDSTRCAECGADLTPRRATRRGHWRKRRPLMALGALLLVACAVLAAGETWSWARAVKWEQHKPMWWLMRSVRADAPETRRSALEELLRRTVYDEVSADEMLQLAEMGLAHHSDESIEWEPLWGSMIDAAIDHDLLSAEQIGAYFDNAVSFELMLSPGRFSTQERWPLRGSSPGAGAAPTATFRSSQWDSIELNLIAQWNRVASERRYYEGKCEVLSVALGDVALPDSLYRDPEHPNSITLRSGYGYAESIAPLIPVVVPPGEYEVRASVHVEIFAHAIDSAPLRTLDLELSAPMIVGPAAPDAVEIVIDEASSQLVREAARITLVGYRRLPTHQDPQSTAPGMICSVSSGDGGWFGFGDAGADCPLNANLDISLFAGGVYVDTMSVSLPNSSTFNHVSAPDLTSLDLVVRPSINSRSTGVFDRRTGKPKPRWMGPEFTLHIDDVQWYDSIDDPACPPAHREMIQSFVEMWERMDRSTGPNR